MKECINCGSKIRDNDKYCRHCGCLIHTNKRYILVNIVIILLVLGILFMTALFIASYIV